MCVSCGARSSWRFPKCQLNSAGGEGLHPELHLFFAEVTKSCSIDDVTVRVEEKEGTLRATIKDREGVAGPTVIKQTHAHGYTHAENHKKWTSTCTLLYAQTATHMCTIFSPCTSLSDSAHTVVYCAAWPGPCPTAKRTQIAETESPRRTGRPVVVFTLVRMSYYSWLATEGFFGTFVQFNKCG